jgi:ferritin-like metal-binding protein YciE
MTLSTLQAADTVLLQTIYDAEYRFLAGMRQLLPLVTNPALRAGIQLHITQTQGHILHLQQVFAQLHLSATRATSTVAVALVSTAGMLAQAAPAGALRDSVIDGALDQAEHYEIASYRTLIAAATAARQTGAISLLRQNLVQEQATSKKLESLAPQLTAQAASQP